MAHKNSIEANRETAPSSLILSSKRETDGPLVPATGVTTTVSKTTAAGSNTEAVEEGLTTPESAETQASESSQRNSCTSRRTRSRRRGDK